MLQWSTRIFTKSKYTMAPYQTFKRQKYLNEGQVSNAGHRHLIAMMTAVDGGLFLLSPLISSKASDLSRPLV